MTKTLLMIGYDDNRPDNRRRSAPPLHSEKIKTDRKTFFLDLKENDRGQFIKFTEDVRGRRDTVMIPIENLDEVLEALQNIRKASDL